MIYFVLLAFFLVLMAATSGQSQFRPIVYWVVLAAQFSFSAFRFEVGCDWSSYTSIHSQIPGWSWAYVFYLSEIGYYGLNKILAELGLPFWVMTALISFIFFYGAHHLAQKTPYPLAFLIFIFPVLVVNMPMSAMRQAAALGFLCLAIVMVIEQKPWRFLILILMGAMFHQSILLFAAVTPFIGRKLDYFGLAIMLATFGVAVLVMSQFTAGERALDRYVETHLISRGAIFRIAYLCLPFVLFFMLARKKWLQRWPEDHDLVFVTGLVSFALLFGAQYSPIIADRLAYYLMPIQAIVMTKLPALVRFQEIRLVTFGLYASMIIFFLVWMYGSSNFQNCYLPYQMIF